MRDDELAILLLGGLFLMSRDNIEWGRGWTWPVPPVNVHGVLFPPEVSQEFREPAHLGLDIMYRRLSRNGAPANYDHGTADWFAPPNTPIRAARSGKVWSCERTARGWAIVLDHGKPFATFYQHLAIAGVAPARNGAPLAGGPAQQVVAGDVIGTMGFDPTDPAQVRHLHFAVWYKGRGDDASVNPAGAMTSWLEGAPWTA